MTLGLPKNHVWESAGAINTQGEGFLPNMPTEEVFTMPELQKGRRKGRKLPAAELSRESDQRLQFLTFHEGKVVDFDAREGYDA